MGCYSQFKPLLPSQMPAVPRHLHFLHACERCALPHLHLSDALLQAELEFVPSLSWSGFNPAAKGSIILRAMFDTPRRLSYEQALKLSIADHCGIWRVCIPPVALARKIRLNKCSLRCQSRTASQEMLLQHTSKGCYAKGCPIWASRGAEHS